MAWVVQKIFHMAADGTKVSEIARCLNEMEVPTKYLYHRAKGDNFPCVYGHTKIKLWDCSMISKTIKNQVYLGKLVWNQSKRGLDTGKKTVKQPKEEWIVYENHHQERNKAAKPAVFLRILWEKPAVLGRQVFLPQLCAAEKE